MYLHVLLIPLLLGMLILYNWIFLYNLKGEILFLTSYVLSTLSYKYLIELKSIFN